MVDSKQVKSLYEHIKKMQNGLFFPDQPAQGNSAQ